MKFTSEEEKVTPSPTAIQHAENLFVPFKLAADNTSSVAQLIFDSYQQVQVGLRGAGSVPRQLLYKCGSVCIEMRLEPNLGSRRVELLGQVLDEKEPLQNLDELPVSLLSNGDAVLKTITNRFGEFYFGFNPSRHLELMIRIQKGNLVIPIPETEVGTA